MSSINKVILIGHLGANPESRVMPSGETVCSIRVATTEKWKDRATGESREATEWHRVVAFRKLAEIAVQNLKKGSQVYLEGRLRTRKWQDKDGKDRYTTEIEAFEILFLGGRNQVSVPDHTNTSDGVDPWKGHANKSYLKPPIDIEDIPF